MSGAAPAGWAATTLGHVCDLLNGRAYKQTELLRTGKYRVLRVGNFFSNPNWYFSDLELEPTKYCDDGDLLYAWSASFGPKIWDGGKVIYHYHIWKTQPNESAVAKVFLYHWFEWDKENIKAEHGTGSTMIHVTKADMESRPLNLPPLPEQHRIVSKIDSLSGKSKRARDHLDHVPRLVEKYKQAVLAAAFRGDLTSGIRATRGWPSWKHDLAMNVCAKVQSGGTPKQGFEQSGIPFLKVYNIVRQQVSFEHRPQFVNRSVHESSLAKSKAYPGDVLMNIVGPPLGKVGIVPDTYPEWNFNQALTLFRPTDKLRSKWIFYFLCSGVSVSEIANETKGSAGQVNISLSQCRLFQFPVPSVDEQDEIVGRIEHLFTWIDRLAAEATSARKLADRLDQAILAKAFRGELVPQDPNDEPASVLLDRIRAERDAGVATASKRKVRKAEV